MRKWPCSTSVADAARRGNNAQSLIAQDGPAQTSIQPHGWVGLPPKKWVVGFWPGNKSPRGGHQVNLWSRLRAPPAKRHCSGPLPPYPLPPSPPPLLSLPPAVPLVAGHHGQPHRRGAPAPQRGEGHRPAPRHNLAGRQPPPPPARAVAWGVALPQGGQGKMHPLF